MYTLSVAAVLAPLLLSAFAAPLNVPAFAKPLLVSAIAEPSFATPGPGKAVQAAGVNAKAIYLMRNAAQNAVIAVPLSSKGMLNVAGGSSTPTGGSGASGIDSSTNQTAAPDALFSQSSLKVAGNNLFAVNPGSNTLTMFAIDPKDPTKLTMVGQPAALPGEFPNTVAVSAKNKLACVGTTGAKAGVSCASFNAAAGLGKMDSLRPFNIGQTTPPVGPLNTVSQVLFSEDESTVFATVKGNPAINSTGFLASFAVTPAAGQAAAASVSEQGQMISPRGTAVLFGTVAIPGTANLFATDASFGAAVLGVQGKVNAVGVGENVQNIGAGVVQGQKATCWAAISPATGTAFVTDVGVNRLVQMSAKDASVLSQIDLSANEDPGLIDLAASGNLVYALSPGNGTTNASMTVVSTSSMSQVQHADLSALGASSSAQGVTLLE